MGFSPRVTPFTSELCKPGLKIKNATHIQRCKVTCWLFSSELNSAVCELCSGLFGGVVRTGPAYCVQSHKGNLIKVTLPLSYTTSGETDLDIALRLSF